MYTYIYMYLKRGICHCGQPRDTLLFGECLLILLLSDYMYPMYATFAQLVRGVCCSVLQRTSPRHAFLWRKSLDYSF